MVDVFIKRKGYLSQKEAVEKALKTRGAKLGSRMLASHFHHSKPVFSVGLNEENIDILRQHGFKINVPVNKEDVTRVSYRPNDKISYHWNFCPGEKIELLLGTHEFADYSKGVPFLATIDGTLNPSNRINPGLLAFCTAFAHHKDAPPVVEEIASTRDGKILVKWSEMDLEGTKSLNDLWEQISVGYPSREHLPRTFQIEPNPHLPLLDDFDAMRFVTKEYQSAIVAEWEKQIAKFAAGLI